MTASTMPSVDTVDVTQQSQFQIVHFISRTDERTRENRIQELIKTRRRGDN